MQSSGSCTVTPTLTHEQSVDYGSGTDVFSLINANPELSETSHFDFHASTNMALPLGNDQPSSENIPPVRSAVVDWVQEQSQHDKPSKDATGLQHVHVDETPPRGGQAQHARAKTDNHASRQEGCQPAKKVYDIATLLRLRETQSAVPVMLRVKPEAIAENIFQYMGAATSRRLPTRSRGFSDVSNISNGIATKPRHMTQPYRQPHAPPETSILQRHDGFARFLKQHASPPHHRVTAGGRIVPTGPTSPPPMFDFGSLNGLLQERPATAKSFQKESHSTQSNPRAQNPQATSSMTLGGYLQSHGASVDGMSLQNAAQPTAMQTDIPFKNSLFGYQSLMAPAMQTQVPIVPLAMFPDGSTLVSYNGMNYRTSWNGTNTTMEPLQPIQLPVDQQYFPQAYSQGCLNGPGYSTIPQPLQTSVPTVPLTSTTNVARPDNSKADVPLQCPSQNGDELSLKTQLTNLDKYLALYHYDITPAVRASLIAQRRCLVEEIDRIRVSKEKPKHSIPIIAPPTTGLAVTPAAQLLSVPESLREAAKKDQMAKGGTINKHLSPAAPAFVPRNNSILPSASLDMRTASQQAKHEQFGMRAPSGGVEPAPKTQNNAKPFTWTSHPDQNVSFLKTQTRSHNGQPSSSGVLDPSDPAMRVIDYEDIEYAARYLYNETKVAKTYCTTVAEFQEAVRRVREQARLYGCAGGQSKDPAYDAEQDLWWAICDRDPIPLPSKVPDHVTNPRPWNWNDSAFNYRRQGANDNPGPGCQQARNSPRIFGWDPATTDKMKDVMDLSNSYYALKGQLPSVSFRDFACDRDGKKRLIQSDTAAPTAYATASKDTAYHNYSPMAGTQRDESRPSYDSSALKEMSTGELNVQHTGSAFNAQPKPANNGKALQATSVVQKVARTPEHKSVLRPFEASNGHSTTQASKPHLSTGHEIAKSKNAESSYDPHHAYIEDFPETPVAGGTRSASKGAGTPQMATAPSEIYMDPLPNGSGDAHIGSPSPAYVSDSTTFPGSSREPTKEELYSIWYQTPLDEVTQKYLDDMKAYNPFNNNQIDGSSQDVHAEKGHHQSSESSDPVTESKTPWGPEEGTAPTTPNGSNRLEPLKTHSRAEEHGVSKIAKVNIPSASTVRAPIPRMNGNDPSSAGSNAHSALDSREVNAINVPSVESTDSHQFLRKMLKSPHYSSAQPMSILSQISSTLAEKINGSKRAQAKGAEQQFENNVNTASNTHRTIGSGLYANSRPSSSAPLARSNPNLAVGKAQSSLASSTYQAHGYLPQFDGAGKAHTSSVYREQGIQPLPQVRLPSEISYGDRQYSTETSSHQIQGPGAYTASTTYHSSVNFGYDGGRDSPPPKTTNSPKDQQSTRSAFNFLGVTQADFDNKREDTNNAWHHGAVEDFFQHLREKELKTIASQKRVNTQSAG